MELRVLGEVVLCEGSRCIELRPVERRLVAALSVSPRSTFRYEALAEAVWGPVVPPTAKHSLQAHVRRIRAKSGPGLVVTGPGGYRLAEQVELDVDAFEAAIKAARSTKTPALAAWDRAVSLWRGAPYDDLVEWAPAESERARLIELWQQAAEERCAAAVSESPRADVVAEAERLVHDEPLRERRWALLMSALDANGERAAALRTFDRARRLLATELGISPGADLVRLHDTLLRDREDLEGPPEQPWAGGRLPATVSSLVGRDPQLRLLEGLFEDGRVVTLTGPGGVGKTRLALAYAHRRRDELSAGVWWAELAVIREAAALEPVIAATLGIATGVSASPRHRIIEAIGDRELLLVLDNCEHLLPAVAAFATDALTACGQLRLLATSREPLAVAGERVMPVPPLPVDGAAVELFIARVKEADPSFAPDDVEAITAISHRLDGIPLAIELAAARARTLGVSEIAARLDDRFELLVGRRGGSDRHHTMGAALDWSYDLLDGPERVVFDHLSVFRGRFELDAVEHVIGNATIDVVATLASLVDKSMVVADSAAPARYRLLEPLRQYADDRLRANGNPDDAAVRHAAYYAALATRLNTEQRGPNEIDVGRRLDAARENFRAAFNTAIDHDDAAMALTIPVHLHRYASTHVWSEPWTWSVAALDVPGASDHPLRPAAMIAAGDGAWQRGEHARAVELTQTVIDQIESGTELWREAHRVMAAALMWLGRFDDAAIAATASITGQSNEVTDATLTRLSTYALIRNATGRPDPQLAQRLVDDATNYGNPTCLALALHTAGIVLGRGDPALGVEYQRRAAMTAAATGAVLIEGFALATLAGATADDDPLGGARAEVDVMKHYLRVGNHAHLRSFARGLIRPLVSLQAYEAAAIVDGATCDQPELGKLAASRQTNTQQARRALGPTYQTLVERGARMADDELVAYLDGVITDLSA